MFDIHSISNLVIPVTLIIQLSIVIARIIPIAMPDVRPEHVSTPNDHH